MKKDYNRVYRLQILTRALTLTTGSVKLVKKYQAMRKKSSRVIVFIESLCLVETGKTVPVKGFLSRKRKAGTGQAIHYLQVC